MSDSRSSFLTASAPQLTRGTRWLRFCPALAGAAVADCGLDGCGGDALHAMNSLRILSTADPSEVVGANKRDAQDEGVRRTIQQNDWPPAGYIKLYFANRQLLVYKNKMLLGIESPPSFR